MSNIVEHGRKDTKQTALASENKNKIFFPTDDDCIVMGGKAYGDQTEIRARVQANTQAITDEVARAQEAELATTAAIEAEKNRAEAAEKTNLDNITDNAQKITNLKSEIWLLANQTDQAKQINQRVIELVTDWEEEIGSIFINDAYFIEGKYWNTVRLFNTEGTVEKTIYVKGFDTIEEAINDSNRIVGSDGNYALIKHVESLTKHMESPIFNHPLTLEFAPSISSYVNINRLTQTNENLVQIIDNETKRATAAEDACIAKKTVNCHIGPEKIFFNDNSLSIRIIVIPGKKYYIDTKNSIQFLYYVFTDENNNYVGERKENTKISKHIEVAPSGSYYLYVCVSYMGNGNVGITDVGEYSDYIGDIQTNTEAIHFVKETTNELAKGLSEITEVLIGKNIYIFSNVGVVNGLIGTNGTITQKYNGFTTGLIPIMPNHYYSISNRSNKIYAIRCVGQDKETVMKVLAPANEQEYTNYYLPNSDASNHTPNGQFKTPENAAFVQITLTPSNNITELGDYYKIMLEDAGEIYNPDFVHSEYEEGYSNTIILDNSIDKDKIPTQNSTKPVESGGVYNALQLFKEKKSLRVLLIGSSHGVNTISMFPVLAKHAGVNIVCGNLYTGSATIGFYKERPTVQIPFLAENDGNFSRFAIYDGEWTIVPSQRSIKYALNEYKWDVIILQRGASENTKWNEEMANYFQNLLDYIKNNCDYNPRIYFNSGIANANNTDDKSSQVLQTKAIMTSAKKMKGEFGIDIIPTGIAVQYARATCLHNIGSYTDMASDSQHLDTGVGQYVTGCTVFDKIVRDFFNLDIRELDYLPAYSDVANNVVNSGSEYFTPITNYYSRIAKTVAALAVQEEEYIEETATMLHERYGSLPVSYTITNTLAGCRNQNNAMSINSDEVYMTTLDVDSGKTMQSVVVTMDGVDVTSSVYIGSYQQGGITIIYHAIRIGKVTGDIVITAVAI